MLSLRHLLEEIGYPQSQPTAQDNEGAIKVANNPKCNKGLKHIEIKYHLVRDAIQQGKIKTVKIGTLEQTADLLTKALSVQHHNKFTDRLVH